MYLDNYIETDCDAKLNIKFKKNDEIIDEFDRDIIILSEVKQKDVVIETIDNVELWDIDNPALYNLEIELRTDNDVVDNFNVRFGFREAVFKDDGFYLNGRKIKLRGLNRHQSFPYVGYAMPKSAQYKDAEILKNDLGLNTVRLSHYPQSDHFWIGVMK